jgi:hypothetical protein
MIKFIATETVTTDFYNLKSKAAGARRIGFIGSIVASDEVAQFRANFQTTLDGVRYQSSKPGRWVDSKDAALADLKRTIAGAIKRYHRLAQDPASRIEYRPVIQDGAQRAKVLEDALLVRFPDLKGKLIVC